MSERLRAALVSIPLAGGIGVALLAISTIAGWLVLGDGHTERGEIALGTLLLVIGAVTSGAVQQGLSSVERGPEILVGQLVVVIGFVIAGDLFDGTYDRGAIGYGLVLISAKLALLCGVGARVAWALRR